MEKTEYIKNYECIHCKTRNSIGVKNCTYCGRELQNLHSELECGNCSTINEGNAKYCKSCGYKLILESSEDLDLEFLKKHLFGKYNILEMIGEGGFSKIYLAEHISLHRKEVIKLLKAGMSESNDIRNRFLRESRILAKLNHPNIIRITDVYELEGRSFYIMEFKEGKTLQKKLDENIKFTQEQAIKIILDVSRILAEVHKRGIIHRDLKPDNLLIDDDFYPTIIDFGISKSDDSNLDKTLKTEVGFMMGTAIYMSPEQIEGIDIDFRTDIYSLGIILYQLLSNKIPFDGQPHEILHKKLTQDLPLLDKEIDKFKQLQNILIKATERNKENRYPSIQDFQLDLENLINKKIGLKNKVLKTNKVSNPKIYSYNFFNNQNILLASILLTIILFILYKIYPISENIIKPGHINSIGMEFILIPKGEFVMGCVDLDPNCNEDEMPSHKVEITKSFYLGKYEVTQKQWKKIISKNPSLFKNCGDDCPVERVSLNDIRDFINGLCKLENHFICKYRLPTEAEWEYAARAGENIIRFGGENLFKDFSYSLENSSGKTHPVGEKKPNNFGLYDMIGNVSEWTNDFYDNYYYSDSPHKDPKNEVPSDYKVIRGGAYYNNFYNQRLSKREGNSLKYKNDSGLGFRLLLEVD